MARLIEGLITARHAGLNHGVLRTRIAGPTRHKSVLAPPLPRRNRHAACNPNSDGKVSSDSPIGVLKLIAVVPDVCARCAHDEAGRRGVVKRQSCRRWVSNVMGIVELITRRPNWPSLSADDVDHACYVGRDGFHLGNKSNVAVLR